MEPILGVHPLFGTWVARALEGYLQSIQKEKPHKSKNDDVVGFHEMKEPDDATKAPDDATAIPVFMDCHGPDELEEVVVPAILRPLEVNPYGTNGNMVEQRELSADKTTKLIMLHQSTWAIARVLVCSEPQCIL